MWMLIFITFLQTPVMKDLAPGCVQGFNNVRQCHKKVDVLTASPTPTPLGKTCGSQCDFEQRKPTTQ